MQTHPHTQPLQRAGGWLTLLAATGVAGLLGWALSGRRVWLAVSGSSEILGLALLWLLRNPARPTPPVSHAILAVNDGEIVEITRVFEDRYLRSAAIRITVRSSLADVQVHRAPIHGTVRYRRYEPGQGQQATDNNWLGIRGENNARVLLRQVARPLWNNLPHHRLQLISCLPDLDDRVWPGQEIGHLPLGGQVAIYIPSGAQVTVQIGQRVRAGTTPLAFLDAGRPV